MNYDAWLEEPYQQMIADGERAYHEWCDYCEMVGLDPEASDDEDHPDYHRFEQHLVWRSLWDQYDAILEGRQWEKWEIEIAQWEKEMEKYR